MNNQFSNPPSGEGRTGPLVTCLCLTRNRRRWLPRAINCFLSQTYVNRELLILADGDAVDDLIPEDERIRLVKLRDVLNIGAKRNKGVELANGDIICHLDDDDYSAPTRVSDQVERMFTSGKQATGYHTMKFTDGADWWVYKGYASVGLGTSLCYWKEWAIEHPFPSKQLSEDNCFVSTAIQERVWLSVPAVSQGKLRAKVEPTDLMYASLHAGNTSGHDLDADCWQRLS